MGGVSAVLWNWPKQTPFFPSFDTKSTAICGSKRDSANSFMGLDKIFRKVESFFGFTKQASLKVCFINISSASCFFVFFDKMSDIQIEPNLKLFKTKCLDWIPSSLCLLKSAAEVKSFGLSATGSAGHVCINAGNWLDGLRNQLNLC